MLDRGDRSVVVGGGPAGSSCAWRIAKSGRPCMLLDKATFPRRKVCGGILSNRGSRMLLESGIITESELDEVTIQEHYGISFWDRGELLRTYTSPVNPVRIVSREILDNLLLSKAADAGAEVLTGERVESVDASCVLTSSGRKISYGNLVGADGCTSTVRKFISGRRSRKSGLGLQYQVPARMLQRMPENLEIHFGHVRYGYIWVFPAGETVRIGAGAVASPASPSDIVEALQSFMVELSIPYQDLELAGGAIPSLVLHRNLGRDNLYLAGDAAGVVDQVSGEGISQAIESGILAAHCILEGGRRREVLDDGSNCIDQVSQSIKYRHLLYSRLTRGTAMMSIRDNETFPKCYWDIISGTGDYKDMFRRIIQ